MPLHLTRDRGWGLPACALELSALQKQAPDLVGQRGAFANQVVAHPVQRLNIQLLFALDLDEAHGRAQQRGEVMPDVLPAAGADHPSRHPVDDTAALEDLPQHNRPRVAGQATGPAFDPERAVEPRRDRL